MGISPDHFLESYVVPGVTAVEPPRPHQRNPLRSALALVLGTAMAESDLRWTRQVGGGPALGFFQMEPATHDDIWRNWLDHRPLAVPALLRLVPPSMMPPTGKEYSAPYPAAVIAAPAYGAAMARLQYLRDPEPLPQLDARALARYHERVYNTRLGAVGRTPDVLEKLSHFGEAIAAVERLKGI